MASIGFVDFMCFKLLLLFSDFFLKFCYATGRKAVFEALSLITHIEIISKSCYSEIVRGFNDFLTKIAIDKPILIVFDTI